MKCCGECPFLDDCRQILDVNESTTLTENCPIFDENMHNFINQLIRKIAEVIAKARQDQQDRQG